MHQAKNESTATLLSWKLQEFLSLNERDREIFCYIRSRGKVSSIACIKRFRFTAEQGKKQDNGRLFRLFIALATAIM